MAKDNLQHKLKNRHLQMIAIGGVIGTGLFFGSAKSIQMTGPSIVLSYLLGGLVIYIIMRALGEMVVDHPNSGSFSEYAHRYLGKYAGFIVGWTAWFEYTVVCMVEITAVTFFLDYWFPGISHWQVCLGILILFTVINLMSIRLFGEFEFWFAGIKVFVIVAMLALTCYLIFFKHGLNPQIGEYTQSNILFAGGLQGFMLSLVIVMFSFGGTEFVTIAAGEAENPQKSIPTAINGVILRIVLFYVLTMLAIICLYPFAKLSANISPFVDVFDKIGIPVAADIMNAVAITAALSAFNSCMYASSRMFFNLASNGYAPKRFAQVNKQSGIPVASVLLTSFSILLAVLVNYLFPEKAIIYLLTIVTAAILIVWFIILLTQLKFRLQKNTKNENLSYKLGWFPYSNIFAMIMILVVAGVMTQMPDMKLSVYVTPLWVIGLSVIYYIRKKLIK